MPEDSPRSSGLLERADEACREAAHLLYAARQTAAGAVARIDTIQRANAGVHRPILQPDRRRPSIFELLETDFATCHNLEQAVETLLRRALAFHGAPFANVQLLDRTSGTLRIAAQRGFRPDFLATFRAVSADDGSACGRALRTGRPVSIADTDGDAEFAPYRGIAAGAGFRAVQSTPLISGAGRVIGVVSTHFPRPRAFTQGDTTALAIYARHAANVLAALAP